jgi:hypothetical protein
MKQRLFKTNKIKAVLILMLFTLSLSKVNAKTIYVNYIASGANNGTSWANAYTQFEAGVGASVSGDVIFVAKGTYQPTSGASFIMKEGVKIYGSFKGTESSLSQRV